MPNQWFLPQEWRDQHSAIKNSFQLIVMRVKLYFAYEEIESAIKLTFQQLMNFPQLPEIYFPKHYLSILLQHLTFRQKKEYLDNYKQECIRRKHKIELQFEILEQLLRQEMENKTNYQFSLQVEDLEKLDFVQYKKKLAREKVNSTVRTASYVVPVKKYSISDLKQLSNGIK